MSQSSKVVFVIVLVEMDTRRKVGLINIFFCFYISEAETDPRFDFWLEDVSVCPQASRGNSRCFFRTLCG